MLLALVCFVLSYVYCCFTHAHSNVLTLTNSQVRQQPTAWYYTSVLAAHFRLHTGIMRQYWPTVAAQQHCIG